MNGTLHEIKTDLAADMGLILVAEIERYLSLYAAFQTAYPESDD